MVKTIFIKGFRRLLTPMARRRLESCVRTSVVGFRYLAPAAVRSPTHIKSGSIGINITHSFRDGTAVSPPRLIVGTRQCRVLYIIPVQPETISRLTIAPSVHVDAAFSLSPCALVVAPLRSQACTVRGSRVWDTWHLRR
jgi:hypothetical protein